MRELGWFYSAPAERLACLQCGAFVAWYLYVSPGVPMFTGSAFESWPMIFVGALIFATLFWIAAFMGDALLVESLVHPGRTAVGLGGAAFAGYIGVALIIRLERRGARR